jgi:hypothetical protein
MDSADRLAAALRETLTEIVLGINLASTQQPEPSLQMVAEKAAQTDRADLPQRLLYPLKEAQERLGGISRSTLYSLLGSGDLVPVKIGSRSFIPAASLDAFVERLTQIAASSRR